MSDASNVKESAFRDDLQKIKPVTKDLSIILGCYNASHHLETNISDLLRFLETLNRSYELLVVEDGSQDDSLVVLRRLQDHAPGLTVLRNPKNMGKGFSIRNGVLNSNGKYVIFTDTDMAYSKQNLRTVIERLETGHPIVVGNRRLPESIYTANNALIRFVYRRHYTGMAFNLFVRKLFGLTTRDTQSGLKGFHRPVALQIFEKLYTDGFLFDVEIFIRARKLGIPIMDIPVHLTYGSDESTVSQFRSFFSVLPQLIRVKLLELRGAYDSLSENTLHALAENQRDPQRQDADQPVDRKTI
jgi:glycosyltransferase involved in cell wall biosynthesis